MALELEVSLEMTSPILGPWQREPNTEEARALAGVPTSKRNTRTGKPGMELWFVPARGRLVEAVGAYPYRTQVKRRKASMAGKSARGDETRCLSESLEYWRRDGYEIQASYPGRSAGFQRLVGRRTQEQRPKTQQKSDHRIVSQGRRKTVVIRKFEQPEERRR